MAKTRVVLALWLLLLTPALIHATQAAPEGGAAAEMVGTWRLAPVEEGETAAGPGAIKLELRLDAGKLAGTAILPIQGGEKRWPVVDASFDGKTFSFKVDNGESLLAGTMERVDGKFEGHWVANGGEEGGRLTMTRADE
ncbi:MAG TPA: hypothetical protein VEW48_07755 [Thermoanaerobaculia bacterium]|nr:hypothetical protein [Thermoanaerobaculia bacterium]